MNDAQKTMGIISLALIIFQVIPEFHIPLWVRLSCAGAMLIGTMTGEIVKTMGHKVFKLQPMHGFGAKRILIPMSSVRDIPTTPGELFAKFQTSFHADPSDAVFKALGVE